MQQEKPRNYHNSRNTGTSNGVHENDTQSRKSGISRLARMKDPFKKSLLILIEQIEDIYKLNAPISTGLGDEVKDLEIKELNTHLLSVVKNLSSSVKRERNLEAAGVMASFMYISEIININEELKISFADHPGLKQVAGALTNIVGKKDGRNIYKHKREFLQNRQIKVYLTALLVSLEQFENGHGLRKNLQLNYRLLRLIYVLILYGNRLDALLLANFCANQVKLTIVQKQQALYEKYRDNMRTPKRRFATKDYEEPKKPKKTYYEDGFDYDLDLDNPHANYNSQQDYHHSQQQYTQQEPRRRRRVNSQSEPTITRNQRGGVKPNESNRKYTRVNKDNRRRT